MKCSPYFHEQEKIECTVAYYPYPTEVVGCRDLGFQKHLEVRRFAYFSCGYVVVQPRNATGKDCGVTENRVKSLNLIFQVKNEHLRHLCSVVLISVFYYVVLCCALVTKFSLDLIVLLISRRKYRSD